MYKVILTCLIADTNNVNMVVNIKTKKLARKIAKRLQSKEVKHDTFGYAIIFKVKRQDFLLEEKYDQIYTIPKSIGIATNFDQLEKEKLSLEIENDDSLCKYDKLVKKLKTRLGTDKITVSVTPSSIIVDRTDKLECIVNIGNFYNAPYIVSGSNHITKISCEDLEAFNILEPIPNV